MPYLPRALRTLPYGYGGIPVHLAERPIRILQVPFLVAGLAASALRHAGRVDVLHANWLFTALAAWPAARLRGRPLLVTLRGSDLALAERNAAFRAVARWILGRADGVATVSEDLGARARALGASADRVRVVPDGSDPVELDRVEARESLGLGREGPWVVFVGNVIPVKGIDVLLEAVAVLASRGVDGRFALVGGGEGIPAYEEQARALGIADRIRFAGFRPTHEIATWLAACDLFCLPSRSEGLPNSILEAMGAGRAIVATRVGGLPDLIEDEGNGILVPSESPEELADALGALLGDAERRDRMADRGRELLAERGLTWEATAARYLDFYRSLIDGPRTAPPSGR